jgi:hypothetical protein
VRKSKEKTDIRNKLTRTPDTEDLRWISKKYFQCVQENIWQYVEFYHRSRMCLKNEM